MSKTFYGADISRWQGNVDWKAFNPGAAFVFIKATGGDDGLYVDSQLVNNQNGARSLGNEMPRGYYHFAGGNDPVIEADFFVDSVGTLQVGEVLVLDFEININNADVWCAAFINRVKSRTGVTPLFYTNQYRVVSMTWAQTAATGCGLWVADYIVKPEDSVVTKWWPFYAFHQYSSTGTFPGISGNVDCNAFFSDNITDFFKYGKQADVPEQPPVSTPVETTPTPSEVVTPTVPAESPVTPTESQPEPTPPQDTLPTVTPDVPKKTWQEQLKAYTKGIVASVAVVATAVNLMFGTNPYVQMAIALLAALGVIQLPNKTVDNKRTA